MTTRMRLNDLRIPKPAVFGFLERDLACDTMKVEVCVTNMGDTLTEIVNRGIEQAADEVSGRVSWEVERVILAALADPKWKEQFLTAVLNHAGAESIDRLREAEAKARRERNISVVADIAIGMVAIEHELGEKG